MTADLGSLPRSEVNCTGTITAASFTRTDWTAGDCLIAGVTMVSRGIRAGRVGSEDLNNTVTTTLATLPFNRATRPTSSGSGQWRRCTVRSRAVLPPHGRRGDIDQGRRAKTMNVDAAVRVWRCWTQTTTTKLTGMAILLIIGPRCKLTASHVAS